MYLAPVTFKPSFSFVGLDMWMFFLNGMWMVLLLCLARNLFIYLRLLFEMLLLLCFSFCTCGFCFITRARLSSRLLYPFLSKRLPQVVSFVV
jgi:hypothetical protein